MTKDTIYMNNKHTLKSVVEEHNDKMVYVNFGYDRRICIIGKGGTVNPLLSDCIVRSVGVGEDNVSAYLDTEENIDVESMMNEIIGDITRETALVVASDIYDAESIALGHETTLRESLNNDRQPGADVCDWITDLADNMTPRRNDDFALGYLAKHIEDVNNEIEVMGFANCDNDILTATLRVEFEDIRTVLDSCMDGGLLPLWALDYIRTTYGKYMPYDIWGAIVDEIADCCIDDYMNVTFTVDKAINLETAFRNLEKSGKIETYYTGGGIWITGMYINESQYYLISSEDIDIAWHDPIGVDFLSFYNDGLRHSELGEYPCMDMVWSKQIEDLADEEKLIFYKMKADNLEHQLRH